MFKVLAISGSLRVASLNSMLLRAVQRLAPSDIHVDLYRGLGGLPLFNADLEALGPPAAVGELRSRIISSHSVLISPGVRAWRFRCDQECPRLDGRQRLLRQ